MTNDDTIYHGSLRNARSARQSPLVDTDRDRDLLWSTVPDLISIGGKIRLTPDRLVSVISDADSGDPREQAALFSTMLEKEPLFAAHLQTRRLAVLSCPWRIASKSRPEQAEALTNMLRQAGMRNAIQHLLDAIGTGYAGVVCDWLPGGKGIRSFVPVMPDAWTFDEGGYPAINTPTSRGEKPLASYHPAQIVFVQADGKPGLPCRKGVLRTLLWLYLFKNAGFRDWSAFLEKFGMPFILGKLPSGEFKNAERRNELLRSLVAIRSGGAGIGTTETDMQLLNGASSGNQQAYESFQRYCDEIATLVILGQLASSDKAGGLSGGGAQEQVRQDILQADCHLISSAFDAHLIPALCTLSLGIDAGDMHLDIDCEKPEDLASRADRDAKLASATGCRLSRQYAMDKYGIELEEAEDDAPPRRDGGAFSDDDASERRHQAEAQLRPADAIAHAALRRMVDEEAFEAFRKPIARAIREAFGDLDPDSETLVEDFRKRAPAFLKSLPGLMDAFEPKAFCECIQQSMLAAFLNGELPLEFWRK